MTITIARSSLSLFSRIPFLPHPLSPTTHQSPTFFTIKFTLLPSLPHTQRGCFKKGGGGGARDERAQRGLPTPNQATDSFSAQDNNNNNNKYILRGGLTLRLGIYIYQSIIIIICCNPDFFFSSSSSSRDLTSKLVNAPPTHLLQFFFFSRAPRSQAQESRLNERTDCFRRDKSCLGRAVIIVGSFFLLFPDYGSG